MLFRSVVLCNVLYFLQQFENIWVSYVNHIGVMNVKNRLTLSTMRGTMLFTAKRTTGLVFKGRVMDVVTKSQGR